MKDKIKIEWCPLDNGGTYGSNIISGIIIKNKNDDNLIFVPDVCIVESDKSYYIKSTKLILSI